MSSTSGALIIENEPKTEAFRGVQILYLGKFELLCFTGKFPSLPFGFSHLLLLLPVKVRTAVREPNKASQV